jgi:hypothetical protein
VKKSLAAKIEKSSAKRAPSLLIVNYQLAPPFADEQRAAFCLKPSPAAGKK